MASLTLKEMEEHGLHDLCVDLCKNIINSQTSDGSEIKYLLPVKHIISNWSMYDSVEWVNPITKEEFIEPFNSEDTRQRAIHNINDQIHQYNDEVDKLDSQYDDLEERVAKQLYRKRSPYQLYSLTAWMHNPVHGQLPDKWQKTPFDARHFNNKSVFNRLLSCTTEEERVGKFNQMLYEYINAITEGKELIETSTFYYPKMEFDDFMMRSGCIEYINLLQNEEVDFYDIYESPFKRLLYHDGADYHDWDTYERNWERMNRDKEYDAEAIRETIPLFNISDYNLTIDIDQKTLKLEVSGEWSTPWSVKQRYGKRDDVKSWKECGLEGKEGKPNRFMALLIKYAYYNEQTEGLPPIEKASRWDEMVKSTYRENTFYKYQKGLKNILESLLGLPYTMDWWGRELDEPPDIGFFEKQTEKIEQRSSKGKKETVEFEYYETGIGIKLKEVPENLRETGYYTEGLEQWSSDIDGDFNGHED